MNALGKVLTVFVFLGSLVWLGFTAALFATRSDWKTAALNAQKAATDAQNQAKALTQQVLEERKSNDARLGAAEQSLIAIRQERDNIRQERDNLVAAANEKADKTQQLQPVLDEYQQVNKSLQLQAKTLTDANSTLTAARDTAVIEKEKAENRAKDAALQLNVTQKALEDQIEKTRSLVEQTRGADAAEAAFRGDVLTVSKDKDIVVFSGGANAGVKAGNRYVISRATAPYYIGTVVVLDASDPRFSSGVFTPAGGNKAAGEYAPRKGDTVSSN